MCWHMEGSAIGYGMAQGMAMVALKIEIDSSPPEEEGVPHIDIDREGEKAGYKRLPLLPYIRMRGGEEAPQC